MNNGSQNTHLSNDLQAATSIADAFWKKVRKEPDTLLYRYALASSAEATRVWRSETYGSAGAKVARLAHFLKGQGVVVGTPVAILSNTRPEWMLSDIAVQTLGAISVSIYQSLTAAEAGFILYDSGASVVIIENDEQAQKISWLRSNPCPIPEREDKPAEQVVVPIKTVVSFEQLSIMPGVPVVQTVIENEALACEPPELPQTINRQSLASFVYTSGTTGAPKGVIQTHGNHLSNVAQALDSGVFAEDGSLFLYLPLAHSFARLIYYVGLLTSASLVLPAITDHKTSKLDLASTARDIREGGATVVPSVPRLFEKMASVILGRSKASGLQAKILGLCLRNAKAVQRCREHQQPINLLHAMLFKLFAGIRSKIRAQLFGTGFRHAISGGARLDPGVNRFFDSLEIVICEGYGLTETCVATHVNRPSNRKIGSVGPAFDGVEVRISPEDSEISLRGPNVTQGYLNRPQATREAWSSDGWFKTGDVGHIDEDGFLFITDRKKELVITAGGKKIPPSAIEGAFKRESFISHAFLYGDGRPYCTMLFTLNELELRTALHSSGATIPVGAKLSQMTEVIERVSRAVEKVNRDLASYESIKKFTILDEDFTIENGLLTPTMKMKRKVIVARYQDVLESLYSGQ
jgi:long-chain acyl-CoA synthetase